MATATNGPDLIVLDSQDNYFDALAGDDIVFGEGGNDTLHGGENNDQLYGRDGNDKLYGDEGNDVLGAFAHWDDPGDDELYGGIGNDQMYGGSGNDYLDGWEGDDTLYGGSYQNLVVGTGDDVLVAWKGKDKLYGGDGNDWLDGSYDDDELHGGDGNDKLGNAYLQGEPGNDKMYGEGGNDELYGGDGNDFLNGYGNGKGERDILMGGADADQFVLGTKETAFYFGDGKDGYATIIDFHKSQGDQILVHGIKDNYHLDTSQNFSGSSTLDTAIYYKNDLIGVVVDKTYTSRSDLLSFVV